MEPFTSDGGRPFTDADLRAGLGERATVVYTWSPHMPLSVDGYREIAQASRALDARLIPVLFAGGDRAFARSEAQRVGIPDEGLREIASIELVFRDAHVHAPTILVFHAGRVSPVLPGYRNADGYRRFLEEFLTDDQASGS